MQDDQQVPILKHGTLRSGFTAHPIANGLRNGGPKIGDDLKVWFHDWEYISIPPPSEQMGVLRAMRKCEPLCQ